MERFGRTPAHIAAENGHADLVRVRAELGANVDTPKNMAPRQPAWRHITADQMLRVLSELGANLGRRTTMALSPPTFMAAAGGHTAVVRLLAEHGANLDTTEPEGVTPAWVAALGNAKVVRVLAEHGAHLETSDTNGTTPACMAASHGRAEMLTGCWVSTERLETRYRDVVAEAASWAEFEEIERSFSRVQYWRDLC